MQNLATNDYKRRMHGAISMHIEENIKIKVL
jgi:hypothetical protein